MASGPPSTVAIGWKSTWIRSRARGPDGADPVPAGPVGAARVAPPAVAPEEVAVVPGERAADGAGDCPPPEHAAVTMARAMTSARVPERIRGMDATDPRGIPGGVGCRPVDAFDLDALRRELAESGRLYHEFVRTHDLSVGLYVLAAGATDPQGPHTEDEVYHVVSGRGRIRVGDEDRAVAAGSVVFVAADVVHRFHDIEEELVILVVFGPAEYTHRVDHERGHPHGAPPAD